MSKQDAPAQGAFCPRCRGARHCAARQATGPGRSAAASVCVLRPMVLCFHDTSAFAPPPLRPHVVYSRAHTWSFLTRLHAPASARDPARRAAPAAAIKDVPRGRAAVGAQTLLLWSAQAFGCRRCVRRKSARMVAPRPCGRVLEAVAPHAPCARAPPARRQQQRPRAARTRAPAHASVFLTTVCLAHA